MRADLEMLLIQGEDAFLGVLFLGGAPVAFVKSLHPEGFGHVSDGFGKAVQSARAGIQAGRKLLPPGIQERVDGVGGAGAEFRSDSFDRGALARAVEEATLYVDRTLEPIMADRIVDPIRRERLRGA